LLDPDSPPPRTIPERISVKGVRVALADDDTGRADSVAQELRSRGVSVVVTGLGAHGFAASRSCAKSIRRFC